MTSLATPTRIPLNTLAIPFGLSGLAAVWTGASSDLGWPAAIADALWVLAAISWVWLIVAHSVRGARSADSLAGQLRHPAQGPIAALVPIVGMLLGATLYRLIPVAGVVLVVASIVAAALFAGWLLTFWTSGSLQADSMHGGYFLPTVAAGLVAATTAAEVGLTALAIGAFAVGILFWVAIFAALMVRLATRPALPAPLTPTLAIIVAPPAVAGTAWFAIGGAQVGPVEYALAGLTVVMVLMQVFLIPRYRALRFSLGFWSFTFPFAAVSGYAIEWLVILRPFGWQGLAIAILAGITVLIATIGIKSIRLYFAGSRQTHAAIATAAQNPAPTLAPSN
ncbi:transporter [Lacisediminihabitans sp.]|uniref:SLAC1 family transporter n=1 Tax=Lacisediminihabitans sp. TaxID=2787631 RepID=UPI00374D1BB6